MFLFNMYFHSPGHMTIASVGQSEENVPTVVFFDELDLLARAALNNMSQNEF